MIIKEKPHTSGQAGRGEGKTETFNLTQSYTNSFDISTLETIVTGPFPAVGVALAKALLAQFVGKGVMR